jgi:hypothetical protein
VPLIKFIYDDGDYYEGNFKNNQMTGRGTYTYKNGTVENFLETMKKWKKI